MLKHNASDEDVTTILSLFIEEDSTLLFSFYERNLKLVEPGIQEFITEKKVFVNSEWILPWRESIPHLDVPGETPPNIIWFSVKTRNDIKKAIGIDNLFRCVVVKEGEDFNKYSNVLFQQEYYATLDDEDYEYYVGFTNKEYFLRKTLSELKKKFDITLIE